ncbi:MAG: acetoacetyl-CoA reductase [Hyphomonadaceae bacterium]|nr:acetoacetyl-CoA reductase [Hyphomonadaceae bacterium]MBX3510108.1 acetoacetyl-CoA reductase [Hyphomonadaceae bacterium]
MARVALVTGGTRGIGKAISARLKADGYKVAANYGGNAEAAEATAKELGISVYKWDVGNAAECAEGIAKVQSELGPVDVLVNNAGITRDGLFHKMSAEKWDDVIRVDLSSMFYMTRPVIEGMRERGFGRIINISSINGQKGQVGQVNYSAAKAGIIGFTKALAQESASKGVTVNVVAPGYVDTDMVAAVPEDVLKKIISTIPVGRLGKAEEIAAMVAFLASDQAGFITGATMTVNGAQYIAG